MNVKTILTLLTKEYAILFRNRIFLMFGVAFLAFLIGIFYIMPAEINAEEPTVAVYSEVDASEFFEAWDEGAKAMNYRIMASEEEMLDSVRKGDSVAGFIITESNWEEIANGTTADIVLVTTPGLAEEHSRSVAFILDIVFSEMSYRDEDG